METELIKKLFDNVRHVIRGKDKAIEKVVVGLLADGHVLIEDIPGVGKTMLGKALSRSISGTFKRIQFTADILPTDVTGVSVFNQKTQEFKFEKGPVFANIVLADEINRGTPRAQSSLLECMGEKQVTTDQGTLPLPAPFMVIGTQNPNEFEGTYPLLEGQMDRFLLCISMGYPDRKDEIEILKSHSFQSPIEEISAVISTEEVIELQNKVRQVEIKEPVFEYMVDIADWTRRQEQIELGLSPRGTLALRRCTQALALLKGRNYVIPDDVKELAPSVLLHRIILNPHAELSGTSIAELIKQGLNEIEIQVEDPEDKKEDKT